MNHWTLHTSSQRDESHPTGSISHPGRPEFMVQCRRSPVRTTKRLFQLLVVLFGMSMAASHATTLPNIVVILADDLGWGDLGCYNRESKIPTPHLDRLATEGTRFTDAHSPSAVCSPTRYGLLTGRYAWRTRLQSGVLWGYSPPLIEEDRPTLATLLKSRGYVTAAVGKWHLGLGWPTREPVAFGDSSTPAADVRLIDWTRALAAGPCTVGFDTFYGIPASLDMVPYVFIRNDRVTAAPTAVIHGSRSQRQGGAGFWREGPISPDFRIEDCHPRLVADAVDFIRRQRPDTPFFLYFALTSPHDPWVPTASFRGRSPCGPRGDFVAEVDAAAGQISQALSDADLARNTLLLFTSDNGAHWLPSEVADTGHAANGPWRGMKSDAFEGGHRVPLIARWPGYVPADRVCPALIGLNDLFATLAEITRSRIPQGAAEDSISFAKALLGRRAAPRPPLILHSIQGTFVVRDGPWKLIAGADSGGWTQSHSNAPAQLYHLDSDPTESHNLWSVNRRRAEKMARLLSQIRGRSTAR
ncbi:MAG: arylsulfatase [Verrucomicrobiales bacterium]|nr:arylsulfatase [Verrucomicrobiales bacterium]